MTHFGTPQNSTAQTKPPDQITHDFQELIVDQILEKIPWRLPDEAHKSVFEYLEMRPPPREYENIEMAKNIRAKLATSKDKQKTQWEIQRQWCQPTLRKILLANINTTTKLMPPLFTEDTTSDDENTSQVNNLNALKPQQMYNPICTHITTRAPILIQKTPSVVEKATIMRRIQTGLGNNTHCYLKFFNHNEIEQMIDDGIPLQKTITRTQLNDLSHYQETDREIYTIIYDPEEQTLVHLQTTEDYTLTGTQDLTKYTLKTLCQTLTDDHIIGMQVKASTRVTPTAKQMTLNDRFTNIQVTEHHCINCANAFVGSENSERTTIIESHNIETCYRENGHMQGESKRKCYQTQIEHDQQRKEHNQTTDTSQTIADANISLLMEIEAIK